MTDGNLAISHDESDGVEIVRLEGDVDLTNAELVREAVDATRSESVVLDLTDVTFLDSMAISTFDGGRRRLASEQRSLVVVSPPDTPSAWTFRVTGRHGDVCESLEDALLSALGRHAHT